MTDFPETIPVLSLTAPLLLPHTEAPAKLALHEEVTLIEWLLKQPPASRIVAIPVSEDPDQRLATLAYISDIVERPVAIRAFEASYEVTRDFECLGAKPEGSPLLEGEFSAYTREYLVVLEGVMACELSLLETTRNAWPEAHFKPLHPPTEARLTSAEREALVHAALKWLLSVAISDIDLPTASQTLSDEALIYRIGAAIFFSDSERLALLLESDFERRYTLVLERLLHHLVMRMAQVPQLFPSA